MNMRVSFLALAQSGSASGTAVHIPVRTTLSTISPTKQDECQNPQYLKADPNKEV